MDNSERSYRRVNVGEATGDAVTVGIEANAAGQLRAAVWWEAVGDVDADEADYDDVPAALAAAEAARVLHGFGEVVVALQDGVAWDAAWGRIEGMLQAREPIGDVSETDLSDDEAYALAAGIEAERDA